MLRVGQLLKGFCGGYFGDSYSDKRIEAMGADWIVAREIEHTESIVVLAIGKDIEALVEMTQNRGSVF